MLRLMPTAAIVALLSTCSLLPLFAGTATAQEKLTPGIVAQLVEPKNATDRATLASAIDDPDPAVRAVAARVAGLLSRSDMAARLDALLETEADPIAASEQLRALLYLRGADALPHARAAAARLGTAARATLAEWVGRTRPDSFAESLRDFIGSTPDRQAGVFGDISAMVIRQSPPVRTEVARGLAAFASEQAWLHFLHRLDFDIDAAVLEAGLVSPVAAVRERTWWSALTDPVIGRQIAPDALRKLVEASAPSPQDSEWAVLGRELLARRTGRGPSLDGFGNLRPQHASSSA